MMPIGRPWTPTLEFFDMNCMIVETYPSSKTERPRLPFDTAQKPTSDRNAERQILSDDTQAENCVDCGRASECQQAEKESDEDGGPDAVHRRASIPVDPVENG